MKRPLTLAAFLFTVAILPATPHFLFAAPVVTPPAPAVPAQPAEPAPIKSKIDAITVYRGQALVTRLIDLPASTGLTEIVVSELPDRLLANSLFAEPANPESTSVRSISYRERPVSTDVRDEVRALDTQIRALSDKLAANTKTREVLAEQRAYLEKLAHFVAPTDPPFHQPHAFQNRRGLCALLRLDLTLPTTSVTYHITIEK